MNPYRGPSRALLLLALTLHACVPDANRAERTRTAYLGLLAAEDARPESGRDLDRLVAATHDGSAFLREVAVRALGRLENPELRETIEPLLADPTSDVRAAAADALAQAFQNEAGDDAFAALAERVGVEEDPGVRGALAQAIGRLRLTDRNAGRASELLVELSHAGAGDAPSVTMLGVAQGSEALVRGAPERGIDARLARRLQELAQYLGGTYLEPRATKVRVLAFSALGQGRRLDRDLILRALGDDASEVSATVVKYLGVLSTDLQAEPLRRAVSARSLTTSVEGLRFIATQPRTPTLCRYLFAGAQRSPSPDPAMRIPTAIRVAALDALSEPCPDLPQQRSLLLASAGALGDEPALWQPPAHAFISLATLFPSDARSLLSRYAGHDNAFVRAYAARAARILGERGLLRTLARDQSPNVRTAAIEGLSALEGHGVDDVIRSQLALDDGQLLVTAAGLLEGTPDRRETAEAALTAFERISAARRETRRDPRRALLRRVGELGGASMAERLIPYLSDYDALVAADVASILDRWTGQQYFATPIPLPRQPLPTASELRRMEGATVVLHMQGGGEIEIALFPYSATTNVYRFFRQAEEGYFDGLTFHRWVPNFVIQGGSPGANEYEGDGPYTRDEVGGSHWRGSVGISTRGHDTGDGQIFIDLADNVRLDHVYTVIGAVVHGMDVVDEVAEGAVIERAEVREAS